MNSWDEAAMLQEVEGDREFLIELIGTFLANVPRYRQEFNDAGEARDAVALARVAHALRGTAGHFEASRLAAAATAVEDLARADDVDGAVVACTQVHAELDRLCEEFDAFRSRTVS